MMVRVLQAARLRAVRFALILTLLASSAFAHTGTGLTGRYHDASTFTTLVTTRRDATVDFNWGTTIPAGTAITHPDTFSVIWTGQIEPEFSEPYLFFITADDSATLWIDDQVVCHRSLKEATGADHWAVAWKQPGDTAFSIIPGTALMRPNTDQPCPRLESHTIPT